MVYITLANGDAYSEEVLSQKQKTYDNVSVPYKRGDIKDRNGSVLATSVKVYNLVLEPKNVLADENIKYKQKTVDALVKYFGVTEEEVNKALEDSESWYKVLKKQIPYDDVKKFQDYEESDAGYGIVGVWFEDGYIRNYPNGDLACHVLGFVASDNQGLGGLESSYNSTLNGQNGRIYAYFNDDYSLTRTVEPATDGNSIVTTIDTEIQRIVQTKSEEFMDEMGARNISVLVMNPQNCEVLAMYNSHQYDPNNAFDISATKYLYEREEDNYKITDEEYASVTDAMSSEEKDKKLNELWRNFVVSDNFEPGSTYKTFTIAGALEEGVITPDDTFYCDGGQQVADTYIRCHLNTGHGMLTTTQALEQSCNDSLMQIAAKEGRTNFAKYQDLFGFGQRTNIDISGEASSANLAYMIYHENELNPVELATSSFGQGVTVNMMQIGTAFCSVINGGFYYQPHLVKQVIDADGNVVQNYDKILVRRTISESTSSELRTMLGGVVTSGTGKHAAVEGYSIGGKSGTAEKIPRGNGKYILSFIGFAPVENPKVMLYCLVDEPGSPNPAESAAGTFLFQKIASELLPYMNIDKTGNDAAVEANTTGDEVATPIYNDGQVPASDGVAGATPTDAQ